jgi:hypothetical protein
MSRDPYKAYTAMNEHIGFVMEFFRNRDPQEG